jgi:hypothetical protein
MFDGQAEKSVILNISADLSWNVWSQAEMFEWDLNKQSRLQSCFLALPTLPPSKDAQPLPPSSAEE